MPPIAAVASPARCAGKESRGHGAAGAIVAMGSLARPTFNDEPFRPSLSQALPLASQTVDTGRLKVRNSL